MRRLATFSSLCLVQLATAERTYVIDALRLPNLEPLRTLLAGESPKKLIHNAQFERRVTRPFPKTSSLR